MIDVHALDREIPPGAVLVCEYGRIPPGESMVTRTVVAQKIHRRRLKRLEARTAGWTIAGSCLRWDNGRWAVVWDESDGTRHGRSWRTEVEARKHWDGLTEAD